MQQFYFIAIAMSVVVFLPHLKSQCINCTEHWKETCVTQKPGYFCTKGAIVFEYKIDQAAYATREPGGTDMYSSCVPFPYELKLNNNYCCFWSKEMGCQLALHPSKYNYGNPKRRCHFCNKICPCNGIVVLKPLNCIIILCILPIMLSHFR